MLDLIKENIICIYKKQPEILAISMLACLVTSSSLGTTFYNEVTAGIQYQLLLKYLRLINIDNIYVIIIVSIIMLNYLPYQRKGSQHSMVDNLYNKTNLIHKFYR